MYNKFIITTDGTLLMGNVYLHRELLPRGEYTCHGGGLWEIDHQRKCILLYGRSFDFGLPHLEYINRISPEGPGEFHYPIFFVRNWGHEEILEPVWPKI